MIAQIEIRSVYGENKAYPIGRTACQIASLAGTKTLTLNTLRQAHAMGVTIELVSFGVVVRRYAPPRWT